MRAFSLGRSRRVRRHTDFQRIQSPLGQAGRATSAHFIFLVARTTGPADGPARLGLVVTRKLGGAVARNRVKRVCRECFRLTPGFVAPGVDLIVIARPGAPGLGLARALDEWRKAQGALRHRTREVLARGPDQPHVTLRPGAPPDDDGQDPA